MVCAYQTLDYSFMLTSTEQLNPDHFKALQALCALCLAHDGGLPKFYFPLLLQKRRADANWLWFQGANLLAFLGIYFFYPTGCELSLVVAPQARGQGLAHSLLRSVLPRLKAQGIRFLIFSSAKNRFKSSAGFVLEESQAQMCWEGQSLAPLSCALNFRKALLADRQALIDLDSECFPESDFSLREQVDSLLVDKNYCLFLAEKEKTILGKSHLFLGQDSVILSDFAISRAYQGQGYGKALLWYSVQEMLARGRQRLSLELSFDNKKAWQLYENFGFKIKGAWDFWNIPLDVLAEQLKLDL